MLSTTDPGGHLTSFSYADNFSDSASLNSLAYVTTVTLPTTHSPNTQTHTTTAKYEVNTGLVTDSYGQNSEHTTFHYDSLLRPIETDFPDGGKTAITYSGVSQIWTWNFLDANNHTDFRQHIDSMGRMDRTAYYNYDTGWQMQDTCFDSMSRPAFTSYSYVDAAGWGDPSRCSGAGDAFSYDALGRPTAITHSDGSTVNYAYAGRATQISDEGNGSKTVSRILQSDGLGRLAYVCEVSGTTLLGGGGAPASCGLDYTATGFLTTYGYDTLNNLVHVDQGSLAVRSYVYDSLSRMTSEQFPEQNGNTTTYTYNNDSLLTTRVRPEPNNAGGSVTTNYTYDEMHRPTGVSYAGDPTGTPSSSYNYDETAAWSQTLSNTIGRMTSAYAGTIPGIAASLFSYDVNGRPTQNWQCTPRTCGTSAYSFPYSYDQLGDVTSSSNGVNATFTSAYNPAARLTSLTSSWNDANHPPTLLSNAHYGPFGLTTDTLGNGLNEYYTYHPRGWLQNAAFGGAPSAYAQGAVQYSGSEQLHNATYGGGTVTVGFTEPAPVQVQNSPGAQSTAGILINAITPEGKKCIQTEFGRCLEYAYNSGSITINVNGCSVTSYWDETTSAGSVASDLASHFSTCGTVTASPNGSTVNLKSVAFSSGADYPFTASDTWDRTDFTSTNYWPTPASGNMSGGANPTYNTVYDTGTATLCIGSNCSYTYAWNQNDNSTTVASGLAAAVQRDPNRVANASANGAVITLQAIAIGSSGNYALSASSTYDTAHFAGPATSFSVSGMSNGSDGLPDSGTATLTVAGLTKTYTWGASDTSSSIANNLAGQLHADPSRQADYTSVNSCGLNCSQINLQALSAGPDPSYNGGISHSDPSGYFPNSSFNSSPTAATAMTGGATGLPSLYSYSLGFAPDGSITSGNDSANGNWTYGYDEFNRLTSSNKNSGAQTFTYAYDRLGNRWQQTAPQGGPAPQYTFDTNNHIQTGSGVSYDALGNVVNDGLGNTYTWDAENRLVSINGGAWSYVYDAFGRRVAKKQSGTSSSEFLYDLGGDKVTSLDGSGNATAEEIYAAGRHVATYLTSTNSTYFHHTDWLGTLRMDSGVNGASSQTCTGLPFGDGASCTGVFSSANLFTDDFHDAEDNLEHTLFRKLSTTQGRWISPDPSGMAAVNFTNPQTLNMYSYVINSPTDLLDPSGEIMECPPGSLIGTVNPDGTTNCLPPTPLPEDPPFPDDGDGIISGGGTSIIGPQGVGNTARKPEKPKQTCLPPSALAADTTGALNTAYAISKLTSKLLGRTIGIGVSGGFAFGAGTERFAVGVSGGFSLQVMSDKNGSALVFTDTFQFPTVMSGTYSNISGAGNLGVQLTVTSKSIEDFVKGASVSANGSLGPYAASVDASGGSATAGVGFGARLGAGPALNAGAVIIPICKE